MKDKIPFFYQLPENIAQCFRGRAICAHIAAIVLTIIIVTGGLDWKYYGLSRDISRSLIFPAVSLGGLLPIVVPLLFLFFGIVRARKILVNAAYGIAQSALLGVLISSTYKAFTGRIPPRLAHGATGAVDFSHGFQFGFLKGGIFWGWPSSHATIACAMATAFAMLFPEHRALKYLGFLYAAYVTLSVSVSIHWLSEAVAGAIIGTTIGIVVGRSFKKRYQAGTGGAAIAS